MPITVERATLDETDPLLCSRHNTDGRRGGATHLANLPLHSFALMDESFYRDGVVFATGKALFTTIAYCEESKRISVCNLSTTIADFSSYAEQLAWLSKESDAPSVEMLVIHSSVKPPPASFQNSVRAVAPPSLRLSFAIELRPPSATLIQVRKITALTRLFPIPPGYIYNAGSTILPDDLFSVGTRWIGLLAIESASREVHGQGALSPIMA